MSNEHGVRIPLKVLYWAIIIIFSTAIVYATIRFTTKRVDVIEPMVHRHEKEIGILKEQADNIEENVEKIYTGVEEIRKKL